MTVTQFNFQAVGWDSWVPIPLKSIFSCDRIFESAAWFFVIISKFIFTSICEIRIYKKKFLNTKKVSMVYLFRSLVVQFVLYEILCHILIIKRYHIKDTAHQLGLFIWLIWYKLYQMAHIWLRVGFNLEPVKKTDFSVF